MVWTAGPTGRPHRAFNYCALFPVARSPSSSRPPLDHPWALAGYAAVSTLVLFFASLLFSSSITLHRRPPAALKPSPPLLPKTSPLLLRRLALREKMIALYFYVSLFLSLSSASAAAEEAMSAYDVLKSNGLPMGLLPKGIRDFQVDGEGRFEVRLDAPCTAKFESQSEVMFNSTVAGTLSYGQIAALSGVAAQELFLWFPVRGIRVDIPSSGLIYFDVGVIYKRFSLSLFETPPDCIPVSSTEGLAEGSRVARLVSKSQSGKLRYDLDQEDAQRVVL